MGGGDNAGYTIHPYERERLGWITYTEVNQNQFITLPDYVTTGAAIKLNLGNSRYVYIQNSQLLSQFDHPCSNYSDALGVYISKFGSYIPYIPGNLHQFSPKGNFNWLYMGQYQNPWDAPGVTIPVVKPISENPTGTGYMDAFIYDSSIRGIQHTFYDLNGEYHDDRNIHRCWGLYEDVYSDNDSNKNILSKFTNPSILAYGGGSNEWYSIEIQGYSGGAYQIQIYTDQTSTVNALLTTTTTNSYLDENNTYTEVAYKIRAVDTQNKYSLFTEEKSLTPGLVSTNTTWTGSFSIKHNITVLSGVNLTIASGSQIQISTGKSITVNGTLTISGSSGDEVVIIMAQVFISAGPIITEPLNC